MSSTTSTDSADLEYEAWQNLMTELRLRGISPNERTSELLIDAIWAWGRAYHNAKEVGTVS